ncbi:polysaccharide biosynthesis/export family protein [Pseudidiomarina sp. 1ASP75-14]|uniref:polysaccharide export protein n=1 Tax=Pseudidiomarina terrestris TaxID=2820060 RepID=UPI00264F39EF|nr:polysaccharide export protein [Pseudidiomarina sp. 1ASP75-14]MDN7136792.1 polysaccharide biosynthesis/export family protein [Pseudidiomarina sp. 1ASP75-14]
MTSILKPQVMAVTLLTLLLGGCSLAPGGHIPDDSSGGLFSDDNRNAYEQEFSEAELMKLVDLYQISPMLLSELAQKPSKPAFNSALEQARSNYDYTVGRGDILNITVWNHPELTIPAGSMRSAEEAGNWVHNDGTIFYPYIGEVEVAGMKVTEIRDMITRRLAKYIESPQVDVTVAAFRSQRVYVTGAVNQPGTVPVTNVPMTLIEAVNAAGGLSEAANWNRVTLTRGDRKLDFNLRELYQSGNTDQNILLQTNDVVHVARNDDNKIFVLGEVREPKSYMIGQSGITLAEALADAGGWQELSADVSGIFVIRGAEADSGKIAKVYQLNAENAVALVMAEQFELQQRDIVYVTAAPISRWNRVISQLLPSVTGLYSVGRFSDEISN